MTEPTSDELAESIQSLTDYRDRLKNEVISISQKLRIPTSKINSVLEEHTELKQLEKMINRLNYQRSHLLNK